MDRSHFGGPSGDHSRPTRAGSSRHLSAIATESSNSIKCRKNNEDLLRPIFLNGVEVGFAYAQNDQDKRLSVRGLTIALFHFIAAGHQVLALLPHCFKVYREKSTDHDELIALHKMNLVEFTPGFGSDKYTEVNRLAAGAAYDCGGCVVARSQMHSVVAERPCLEDVVERRLLIPSFMGQDIIFPIDGPLGRIGPSLEETLVCKPIDADHEKCMISQMLLEDQRLWIHKLSNLLPEKLTWSALASHFTTWQPERDCFATAAEKPKGFYASIVGPIRPPELNPPNGRGYSVQRRKRNPNRDYYNCPERQHGAVESKEQPDDDDSDFLPSYAIGDHIVSHQPAPRQPQPKPLNQTILHPMIDPGSELHIGKPGSLYRIRSFVESQAVPSPSLSHPTLGDPRHTMHQEVKTLHQQSSSFRSRNDRDQASQPLRSFGFLSSPPRSSFRDTSHRTPPREQPASTVSRSTVPSTTADNSDDGSAVFTQLALILGFDLAKSVTTAHPHERDVNRLANLALDEGVSPPRSTDAETRTNASNSDAESTTNTVRPRPRSSRFPTEFRRSKPAPIHSVTTSEETRAKPALSAIARRPRPHSASSTFSSANSALLRAAYASASVSASADSSAPAAAPVVNPSGESVSTAIEDLIDWDAEPLPHQEASRTPVSTSSTHLLDI